MVIIGSWGGALAWRRSVDRRIESELGRDRAARDAVAVDRARIARDLHDSVAHAITIMTLQAGGARRRSRDTVVVDALQTVESTGRQALMDMHRFLGVLGSDAELMDEAPGLIDIPDIVESSRTTGADVELSMAGDLAQVPASVGATGYRVVQEALTNALKHAQKPTAAVVIRAVDGELALRVASPWSSGAQRPPRLQGGGRGLQGLRERVELFDGCFRAGPEEQVWVVEATIPFAASA